MSREILWLTIAVALVVMVLLAAGAELVGILNKNNKILLGFLHKLYRRTSGQDNDGGSGQCGGRKACDFTSFFFTWPSILQNSCKNIVFFVSSPIFADLGQKIHAFSHAFFSINGFHG